MVTGDTLWRRRALAAKGFLVVPVRADQFTSLGSQEGRARWVQPASCVCGVGEWVGGWVGGWALKP